MPQQLFRAIYAAKKKLATKPISSSTLFFILLLPVAGGWAANFEDSQKYYQDTNYSETLNILRPLAEQGDIEAQIKLGNLYDMGHDVAKDPTKSVYWYTKAAEQGSAIAQYQLGIKYLSQQGVEQDHTKAKHWLQQSAKAGWANAQYELGLLHYHGGVGIEKDHQEALLLFKDAAEQDHPHAQYSLAAMYTAAQGTTEDLHQALRWFRKSALQGVPQAQFNLGIFYENGYILERDIANAKKWYTLADSAELVEATLKLAELTSTDKMTIEHPNVEYLASDHPLQAINYKPPQNNKIKGNDWLNRQPGYFHTLQLSSFLEKRDTANFIQKHGLAKDAVYVEVIIEGVTRYNALYGSYPTYEAAKNATNSLPKNLIRDSKPWIRNFSDLQSLIK